MGAGVQGQGPGVGPASRRSPEEVVHALRNLLVLRMRNVLVALLQLVLHVLSHHLLRLLLREAVLRDVLLELLRHVQVVASGHNVVQVNELDERLDAHALCL